MNPPFVRSVGGNLLFGSVPEQERQEMQDSLKKLVKSTNLQASITAGLGPIFVAIANRYLKDRGRMALILPKTLLSGVAWAKTRELINQHCVLDYVIVSHDAERWNFSESTDLSEVMIIATRRYDLSQKPYADHEVRIVNLWCNPKLALEALNIVFALTQNGHVPNLVTGQGALAVPTNQSKMGEVIAFNWSEMQDDWFLACAFAQSDLTRVAYHLLKGRLWLPGFGQQAELRLCPLSDLGQLGPDRRDIHDGFDHADIPTAYPAFWGHDAASVLTLSQKPNH
jgi:hypothetical protein